MHIRVFSISMHLFVDWHVKLNNFSTALQELIRYMKLASPAHMYATSMSTPAVQQVISALEVILGKDGTNRGK
jgi:serine palmitoyltransferase